MYYVKTNKGWKEFNHIITAKLFAKINGYKLIAIGKENV